MFIRRLDASIASRPETDQQSIVVVGASFFFDIVHLVLVAPLATALEPFVKEKSLTIMAGKWPKPMRRL
jgi:hypothetical protein